MEGLLATDNAELQDYFMAGIVSGLRPGVSAVVKTIEVFPAGMRSEFAALRANNQLEVLRQVSTLSERLATVEKKAWTQRRVQVHFLCASVLLW